MAVMGSNFAQNFADKGFDIALYNRTAERTKEVYEQAKSKPYASRLHPVYGNLKDLVTLVGKDGTYLIMVKAGAPTQEVIDQLEPLLSKDAIIVDCSNAHYKETMHRQEQLQGKVNFFGIGVSGGEEGARYGPSIMVGGPDRALYDTRLRSALEAVAAKAPQDGSPCVAFLGVHGAGHYVKMVHNGIEYADMQLIAEAYDFMRRVLGMNASQIADVFARWNKGPLQSYLVEITAEVLSQKDPQGKGFLVDKIKDTAQMKGTGTWMVQSSLEMKDGVVPIPGIYGAVESRAISARKEERVALSKALPIKVKKYSGDRAKMIKDLERALYVAKIACYAQGIDLLQTADREYGFGGLDIGRIAQIWRAGCIIRARFLGDITDSYRAKAAVAHLTAAPVFRKAILRDLSSLQRVCIAATGSNAPFMVFNISRDYLLQATSAPLPANLTQGQRDYFGAHTYERIDKKGVFHTEWSTKERKERKLS
jgi:6-phosphogluconate dehydrogenase